MYSNSSLSENPVLATALSIPVATTPQLQFQLSRKSIKIIFIAILLFVSKSVSAQLDLKFGTNFTQKVESTPVLNAKYLYTHVATGYDCIITIADIQGDASVLKIDDNSMANASIVTRFQPVIAVPGITNRKSYVRFKFQLIMSGSYNNNTNTGTNAIATEPIWFSSYDMNGKGATNGASAFVELDNSFTKNWIDNTTHPVASISIIPNGDANINNGSIKNGSASDKGVFTFNGFIEANTVSSWDIIGGSATTTVSADPNDGFNDVNRLQSWSFKHEEAIVDVAFKNTASICYGTIPVRPTGTVRSNNNEVAYSKINELKIGDSTSISNQVLILLNNKNTSRIILAPTLTTDTKNLRIPLAVAGQRFNNIADNDSSVLIKKEDFE